MLNIIIAMNNWGQGDVLLLLGMFSQGSKILEINLLEKILFMREQEWTYRLGKPDFFKINQETTFLFDFLSLFFPQDILSILF